jgi:peptide deformylase
MNAAELEIVRYPHPALTTVAEPIDAVTDETWAIARRMAELCFGDGRGVGLAANQVGLPIRMFVARSPMEYRASVVVAFVNPEIEFLDSSFETMVEGCLSMPGIEGAVVRRWSVRMRALMLDLSNGTEHRVAYNEHGFDARVWQHEVDHLNGVNIIDTMTKKHRKKALAKLREVVR